VLLDEERRPLRPAILWNDRRTQAECAEIERIVSAAGPADRGVRGEALRYAVPGSELRRAISRA
jgi:sugar (pentulose or hexulose) kinase